MTIVSNKAVADGGVSFFIDHLVSSRTARFTYGTECNALYNEHDPEHVARRDNAFEGVTGYLEVPHAFESILKKAGHSSLLCGVSLTDQLSHKGYRGVRRARVQETVHH